MNNRLSVQSQLSIGISVFKDLRELNQIYVDKTDLIYDLAKDYSFYFFTRPRRFGKSLLISTIESLFRDGTKYFKGLAIADKWQDENYPVIHLDFSACRMFKDFAEFRCSFEDLLFSACNDAGFVLPQIGRRGVRTISNAFNEMLKKSNRRAVLLVDEYDAPLNSCLHDQALFEQVKQELFSFYDCLKRNSSRFRFMFITGICRYKNLGIFSGMNFMTDISLHPRFGTLLGYTDEELRKYFKAYIERASSQLQMSFEECLEAMKLHYDGYCFDRKASTHVFTPWSVLNFLRDPQQGFENYWYDSAGRPTVLLNYIKSHSLRDPRAYGQNQVISSDEIDSSQQLDDLGDISLLVQAGYLTIKSMEPGGGVLTLNYPNKEVSRSMSRLYIEELFGKNIDTVIKTSSLGLFTKYEPQEIVNRLNILFKSVDYARYPIKDEAVLRSFLQIYLIGGGITGVEIEKHNAFGRSELEFKAGNKYFVIELKYARAGEDAQKLLDKAKAQIMEKHYGECAELELQHIHMALIFSETQRQFEAWECF